MKVVTDAERSLLLEIMSGLDELQGVKRQLATSEFFLGKESNELGGDHCYTFVLDASMEEAFIDRAAPELTYVEGVAVRESSGHDATVELHVAEGILIGYDSSRSLDEVDWEAVDTSTTVLRHIIGETSPAAAEAVAILRSADLDGMRPMKVEWDHSVYYLILSLGDGNYLAESNGKIFSLMHDPFEVKIEYESNVELERELMSGGFRFMG